MDGAGIGSLQIVFLWLLLFVVVFATLARKLEIPYPIVLVIAGLLLGFTPGIPKITLNPNLVFLVVLPPLLYSGAWVTSWRDFKYNLVTISLLAFGLVGFTVLGVAFMAQRFFPGFTWQLGFVLGAIVATTDAIAATAIARRLGLPQRIVDVLEGESLVNDATGLVALDFGLAMVVSQQSPTVGQGALRLAYLVFVGIGLGLLIGVVVAWLENQIDDAPIEIAFSIFVPYATYLAAERIHASGVLAVVACGLFLSRRSSEFFSPSVRIQAWAVWDSFTFVLNGLVFVMIGLQLPFVMAGIREYTLGQLILYGLAFSGMVIVLRLLWMFPGTYVANAIRRRVLHQNERMPPLKNVFIVGWTGMRGVISLAAAISLPAALSSGVPFPQRNLIVFLTFAVIVVTLVLQGLTLPVVIRALGLSRPAARNEEEEEARLVMAGAALEYLSAAREKDTAEWSGIYDEYEERYRQRQLAMHGQADSHGHSSAEHLKRSKRLMRELTQVERRAAVRMRNEGRINDEVLRQLERELDLTEARLTQQK
jgi:monovalent cation/hydrogen antiporter